MKPILYAGAALVGVAIGLAISWVLLFIGAIAVGGIASLFTTVALIPNALLFANYGVGLTALSGVLKALIFGVEVEIE